MSCPACSEALAAGAPRCAGCGAILAAPVEGALAPDLARSRPEPLRELPGRRREKSWKDEVSARVKERRRTRTERGELPLFREQPEPEPRRPVAPVVQPPSRPRFVEPEERRTPPPEPVEALDLRGPEPAPDEPDFDLPLRTEPQSSPGEEWSAARNEAPPPPPPVRVELGEAPEAPAVEPSPEDEGWPSLLVSGAPVPADSRPPERPAQAGERMQAAFLDITLLLALGAFVVYFASRAARVPDLLGLLPAWPYLAGFLGVLALAYASYFTGTTGQTPGKMVLGLRVVDTAGRPPGRGLALGRALLGTLGIALAFAGVVPVLVDPARRAFHDRLLRTRVVKG